VGFGDFTAAFLAVSATGEAGAFLFFCASATVHRTEHNKANEKCFACISDIFRQDIENAALQQQIFLRGVLTG